MKKNRKYILLIIVIIIIVLLSFIMIITKNKKTVCTSINNKIELSTRGNKLYVIGNYNIDPKEEEIIDDLLERYPDSISYDKDNNTLKYYFIYDSSNQELLNFMNIDYLLDANYKKVKSNLESKNYKCE